MSINGVNSHNFSKVGSLYKSADIVLVNKPNYKITMGDFFKLCSDYHDSNKDENVDPLGLTEAILHLIDTKCCHIPKMDKLNTLVECGSRVKTTMGESHWLGHLLDFCIGVTLLTYTAKGDITKHEEFPKIADMWKNFVDNLPTDEDIPA